MTAAENANDENERQMADFPSSPMPSEPEHSSSVILTIVRVVAGGLLALAGLVSVLGSVDSDGTPSVACGGPAVSVAFGGGHQPEGRAIDCRAAGRDQSLGGGLFLVVGGALILGRRLRRWSRSWASRDLRDEMDRGSWRVGPPWRQLASAAAVLVALGCSIGALFDPVWLLIGLIAAGPFVAIVLLMTLRPRIEAQSDGLRITNPLRTYSVRWDEVRDITPGYWGLQIELSDGRLITAFAAQKSNWSSWRHRSTRADDIAAELLRRAGRMAPSRQSDASGSPELLRPVEDPGWRPALIALVPIVGIRIAASRRRNHPASGLVVVRQLFLTFALAIAMFGFVLTQLDLSSADASMSSVTVMVVVGAIAFVALVLGPIVERPLDGSDVGRLAETWRTRFFVRIAFGEAPALAGFAGAFLAGSISPYVLGASATAVIFARSAPSARQIAKDQDGLDERGSSLSLATVLATWSPKRPGR
jgi:hypothetical protein